MAKEYNCNHSKFDIISHKETYVNYLEVIILPNGEVRYAVPSHQENLLQYASHKMGKSRQELYDSCPAAYYCDVINWLCHITGCVSVWTDRFEGELNIHQTATLIDLKDAGIYTGSVPTITWEALSTNGRSLRGKVHRFKNKLYLLHYEENPLVPGMIGCDWVEIIPETAKLVKREETRDDRC